MAILPIKVSVDGISKVDQLTNSVKKLETSAKSTKSSTDKLASGLKTLATGALAYIAIDRMVTSTLNLGRAFVSTADNMSLVTSRLSLVTSGTQQLTTVQAQLLQVSNNARVSLQSTSNLYAQLARSTSSLGLSSQSLIDVTNTISQTLTISGASAESANAALFQLQQGFSAGALRGEELNSVLEQTPRLAQAIADGLGVSIGELRQLGADGALTAETVLNAIQKQASVINSEFKGIAVTAQSGYTVLNNQIDATVAKLDSQHKITQTIGNAMIGLADTVDILLVTAFDELIGKGGDFGEFTSNAIGSVIEYLGGLYDRIQIVGDIFNVVRYSGETAFYGIGSIATSIASGIGETFAEMANGVIGLINKIISAANSTGYFSISFLEPITYEDVIQADVTMKTNLEESSKNLAQSYQDLLTPSTTGRDTASAMIEAFTTKFSELRASQENQTGASAISQAKDTLADTLEENKNAIEDTNSVVEDATNNANDLNNVLNDTNSVVEDANSVIEDLNNTVDDTYTVTTQTDNAFDDLNNTIEETTQQVELLAFAFSDTLLNSITNNMNQLSNISKASAFNSIGYNQALQEAINARNALIANPLDVQIGQIYSDAYNTFISSATDYLTPQNFGSLEEYRFAQATVGTQASQFESTAGATVDVLDSMNNFLSEINNAFADGILTDDEKATISGVADTVNAKNDTLLGQTGVVGAINSQSYYDNTDLAKDLTLANGINTTEQNPLNLSTLAKDTTVNSLYKGQAISTTVSNQLTDYATDTNISNQEYYNNSDLMKDNTFVAPYDTVSVSNQITGFAQDSTLTNGISTTETNPLNISSLATGSDISSQIYYDNTGLMQDSTFVAPYSTVDVGNQLTDYAKSTDISNQTYYDNTDLAKDSSITDVETAVSGISVGGTTIDTTPITNSLVGTNTNSVADYIKDLMGSGNSGISLSSVSASFPALSVNTGLDVSQLSNLSTIKNDMASTKSATNYMTSGNTTALKNLKIKDVSTTTKYVAYDYSSGKYYPGNPSNFSYIDETTSYTYYKAKGGYTGKGIGQADHTGFKQAGIVHEGEYVAPKWMVDSNPMLFAQMENVRKKGSFADGGFTTPTFNVSASMNNSDMYEMKQSIKRLEQIFLNITEGGNIMNVALRG